MILYICSVLLRCGAFLLLLTAFVSAAFASLDVEIDPFAEVEQSVEAELNQLLKEHDAPGAAVAVTIDGEHRIYNFGMAARETGASVTNDTLFEIGDISRTYAGLLAAYAHQLGKLSFFEEIGVYFPSLKQSALGDLSLLDLATHTRPFELFLPDEVGAEDPLLAYVMDWQARRFEGPNSFYSDVGAMLLGAITGRAMNTPYEVAIRWNLLWKLGLKQTYHRVPASKFDDYAQGYTTNDECVRQDIAPLAFAANGIKTTASDLIRFVEAHLEPRRLEPKMERAVRMVLTGYVREGAFTRTLMWEQYAYPVGLPRLVEGNLRLGTWVDAPPIRLKPPFPPRKKVLISKLGATRGFTAYVAFVPASRTGVALLVNKSISGADLVASVYHILEAMQKTQP